MKKILSVALLLGAVTANAAVITWSPGTEITDNSVIYTEGKFVLGHNYGIASGATGFAGTAKPGRPTDSK